MRAMAFDYGTKRIGIAVTDNTKIIASPLDTIHPEKIWGFLQSYLQQEEVDTFIVGDPKQMDGTPSQSAPHVVGFVRKLKKKYPKIKIHMLDERFTSKIAEQSLRQTVKNKKMRSQKELVDQVSATLILQSYLESQSLY